MTAVTDPCPKWAVFDLLHRADISQPVSQISLLQEGERCLVYCCHSLREIDAGGNTHVLSVGIDLGPALESQGWDAVALAGELAHDCRSSGGQAEIATQHRQAISQTAGVLNIHWLDDALANPAKLICPRSTNCPRPNKCDSRRALPRAQGMDALRQQVLEAHAR